MTEATTGYFGDVYKIYVNGRIVDYPADMTKTCHDCGYKKLYKDGPESPIFWCYPLGFSFSDSPACVQRDCKHWVPIGEEDPDVKFGDWYDSEENDTEEIEEECPACAVSTQRKLSDF